MPRFLKVVLAFLLGLIAGWAIPVVWYIVATNYFGLIDRDGGGAMGAIFIMGPILALIVGTVAAIVTAIKTRAA
jgi:MFS family permease